MRPALMMMRTREHGTVQGEGKRLMMAIEPSSARARCGVRSRGGEMGRGAWIGRASVGAQTRYVVRDADARELRARDNMMRVNAYLTFKR